MLDCLTFWSHVSGDPRQKNIQVVVKCRGSPDRPISPLRSGVGRAPTISTCAICHRECKLDFLSFFVLVVIHLVHKVLSSVQGTGFHLHTDR